MRFLTYAAYTIEAVGRAWPILLIQFVVVAALVFTAQGRAFLSADSSGPLAYASLFVIGVPVVFYTRSLAPPVAAQLPDGSVNPEARLRWLAMWWGSIIAGLISAFMLPSTVEQFLSVHGAELPVKTAEGLRFVGALVTGLVALLACAVGIYHGGLLVLPLLLCVIGGLWLGNNLFWGHRLTFFAAWLVASCVGLSWWLFHDGDAKPVEDNPDRWTLGFAVVCLLAGAVFAAFPGPMLNISAWLGSSVIVLVILLVWVTVGVAVGWLLSFARRRCHPLVPQLMIAGLIVALWFSGPLFPARDVRELPAAPAASVSSRLALDVYADKWIESRRSAIETAKPYPVVLVAASGGGIRAAYWTAAVLGALQDANGAFSSHVFAISSVSGGSLGAAAFVALAKARCTPAKASASAPAPSQQSPDAPCRSRAAVMLGQDYLAPTVYVMLTRDLVSALFSLNWSDRAAALEQAFERSWNGVMGTDAFAEPLESLWADDGTYQLPALFLNVTEAGSAGRVVLSPVSLTSARHSDRSLQEAAETLRFRLSTAVMLSARFPYVSPEGKIVAKVGDQEQILRLVDGGFFDNSGTATLADVADALQTAAARAKLREAMKLVVLNIENEPVKAARAAARVETGGFGAPLALLDQLRSVRSIEFNAALGERIRGERPRGLFLTMVPQAGSTEFPLGWTLSGDMRSALDEQVTKPTNANAQAMSQLLEALPQGGQAPATSAPR